MRPRTLTFLRALLMAILVGIGGSTGANASEKTRFVAVDVFVDSGARTLAAYQLEFWIRNGGAKIVGVEGGEHPAFAEPPFHDPKAIQKERVIIGAFSTQTAAALPKGRTRVATIHVQLSSGKRPDYAVKLQASATVDGEKISAEVSFEERTRQ